MPHNPSSADPLHPAKVELEAAERAINLMVGAISFDAYEAAWREFLTSIEKAWNKSKDALRQASTKFQPWRGKYDKLRTDDPVLSYVQQARHADHHTIQEIVEHIEGKIEIQATAAPTHIRAIAVLGGRVYIDYSGGELNVRHTPPRIELLPVVNRKVEYQPPEEHLGQRLSDRTPHVIAQLALKFYRTYLHDAEERFCK